MILTSERIIQMIDDGEILIQDFSMDRLNPNSYNLRLHPTLKVYNEAVLDMAVNNHYEELTIPKEGLVLEPGRLYLGRTFEYTETYSFVPKIDGRSSVGRLGIFVHITAGFGDIGYKGTWTLELACIQPVRIYPMVGICQISYHEIAGRITQRYQGKYQGAREIQTCQLFKDFVSVKE